jgi:ribokinase
MDLVLSVDRLPRAGETIAGGDLALYPGGKGANQACAAGRLGGRVSMIALVGQDAFGDRLIESLQQAGVDTTGVGRSDRATGCASIYVMPNGENSIVISPGANAALVPAALPCSARAHACSVDTPVDASLAASVIASGDYLLAQLETPLETVQAAFQAARDSRALTILDPAPARALPGALLGLVDFLTPNQTEAATILGAPDMQIRTFQDAAEAATQLLKLGPTGVVIKLGSLGCFVHTPAFVGPVEAFPVSAVDTTAAGDVFNGAFAVALAEGKPVAEAARFANAAAAISVTRPGAQSSVPTREAVGAFLAASGGD